MNTRTSALAAALALSMTSLPIARNEGITHRSYGPAGSPKRNLERSVKRMAQRSRQINRGRK